MFLQILLGLLCVPFKSHGSFYLIDNRESRAGIWAQPALLRSGFGYCMACLVTFFNATAGNGSVSFMMMQPVPVLMRGYLALKSAMWWALLVYSET